MFRLRSGIIQRITQQSSDVFLVIAAHLTNHAWCRQGFSQLLLDPCPDQMAVDVLVTLIRQLSPNVSHRTAALARAN
jgi:S-adenosylmethionine/arginine decarboxylase-like enzyme